MNWQMLEEELEKIGAIIQLEDLKREYPLSGGSRAAHLEDLLRKMLGQTKTAATMGSIPQVHKPENQSSSILGGAPKPPSPPKVSGSASTGAGQPKTPAVDSKKQPSVQVGGQQEQGPMAQEQPSQAVSRKSVADATKSNLAAPVNPAAPLPAGTMTMNKTAFIGKLLSRVRGLAARGAVKGAQKAAPSGWKEGLKAFGAKHPNLRTAAHVGIPLAAAGGGLALGIGSVQAAKRQKFLRQRQQEQMDELRQAGLLPGQDDMANPDGFGGDQPLTD
jgi:hypothetical protein